MLSRFKKCCPSGKRPSGSDRPSFEFTLASKRSRRPGLESTMLATRALSQSQGQEPFQPVGNMGVMRVNGSAVLRGFYTYSSLGLTRGGS